MGGFPSHSSPFLARNDGTERGLVHPERSPFETQPVRSGAFSSAHLQGDPQLAPEPRPHHRTGLVVFSVALCASHPLVLLSKAVSDAASATSLPGKGSRRHGHKSRVGREYLPELLGTCRHGHNSRIGWEFLPEQLVIDAHDRGTPRSLGFPS
jgi:hypothetical protein